jgi:hypothetical protein
MKSLVFVSLLWVAGMTVARADDGKCAAGHLSMLQTGVVSLGEVVIDYPIEKVWAVLPYYYEWSVHHHNSERTAIRGERGKVGETVRVHQAGAPSAFYVETIRIRPPKTIAGQHRAGNMAWKISDQDVCFVRFNDFSVREYNGKTIFARSVYEALAPGAPKRLIVGRDQLDGKPDALHSQMGEVKANVEAYIRRTARSPAAQAAPAQSAAISAQTPAAQPTGAAAAAGSCASRHKAMLQTGTVNYGEIVIDRPIDEVWSTLPVFYRWNPVHSNGTRKTIRGEAGKAGEVVEIVKAGTTEAIYTETVRIQPPRTIDGAHRSGHIVWKVYDREGCFSRYSDFGVREYQGKTIFFRAMYGEHDPAGPTYRKIRSEQEQGVPDQLDADVIDMRTRMLEYLKQRESKG